MPFKCKKADLSFLDSASEKVISVVEIPATPEEIFKLFENGPAWTEWFKGITQVEWTSPQPFGVGTTRTVSLGALKVWEYFFVWEDNKRFSFYFTQTNLPFVKTLAEDYQLEAIDERNTRFTYTVAYDPSPILKLSGPIGRAALKNTFTRAANSLVKYMDQ